jgi:hypothetical protein
LDAVDLSQVQARIWRVTVEVVGKVTSRCHVPPKFQAVMVHLADFGYLFHCHFKYRNALPELVYRDGSLNGGSETVQRRIGYIAYWNGAY